MNLAHLFSEFVEDLVVRVVQLHLCLERPKVLLCLRNRSHIKNKHMYITEKMFY